MTIMFWRNRMPLTQRQHRSIKRVMQHGDNGVKGLTRDEISSKTGLPIQTVTCRVRELIAANVLVSSAYPERPTQHGRFAHVLYLRDRV